jgi:Ribbon-helix-helix protein, copG family
MRAMKRLQIMIEKDIDAALGRRAREEGVSKAALIRRYVRMGVAPLPPLEDDPLWAMVAADGDAEPTADIDEVVYGGKLRARP